MKITITQAEKILKSNQAFSQFGFSMMLTRLRNMYAKDSSQSTLITCMDEINVFLDKFNSIMGDDYKIIAKM